MINIDAILKDKVRIGISGHVRPDGDCIGSTLAVYNYIKEYYPQAQPTLFLEIVPNIFKFLSRADEIVSDYPDMPPMDLFITLDCAEAGRVGKAAKYYESAAHTLCIDHHETNGAFADDNYIVPEASSTCELVYEVLPKERITKEIAECLYTGIIHDTGVFQYSCTSSHTMAIAGDLMDRGIDYPTIVNDTFYIKTYRQQILLGEALVRSKMYLDGKVILTYLTPEEMRALDALPKDLEGIVSQLRSTKDVKVAVFFYPSWDEDGYKFSTRANGDGVNLAQLALKFGGGGHAKAAGFTMHGTLEEVKERILQELTDLFGK